MTHNLRGRRPGPQARQHLDAFTDMTRFTTEMLFIILQEMSHPIEARHAAALEIIKRQHVLLGEYRRRELREPSREDRRRINGLG